MWKTELLSIGPNAVGRGTSFTLARLDPFLTRGVITAWTDEVGNSAGNLPGKALSNPLPQTFPNDPNATPLRFVHLRMIGAGQALAIADYGRGGNVGRFIERLRISPGGYRHERYYDTSTDHPENLERGYYKALYREVPVKSVVWSDVIYSDSRPNLHENLEGTINGASYTIDGYSFVAESLMFEAVRVVHHKLGGIDRWYRQFHATYNPKQWKQQRLDENAAAPGVPLAPSNDYLTKVNWPNLP